MSTARALAAALGVTALIAAGCGDDDAPTAEATTTTTSTEKAGGGGPDVRIPPGSFDPKAIFDAVAPGVVTIRSVFGSGGPLGQNGGQGSGFVLNGRGEIATNAHVVTDAEAGGGDEINAAEEVFVEFADRNQVPAEVVGFDPHADVALIKVEPDGIDLAPVALAEDDGVEVGDPVAAIGSPFGQEQSLSIGIVSARDRSIASLTQFNIDGAIQTDASINPGNSGGPLLDAAGKVIGINQQINTTSGGDEGVGFAVPVALVRRSIEQLRSDGEAAYAFLGVTTQALYPQLARRLDLDLEAGALVAEVVDDGPAAKAGIRAGEQEIDFQAIPEIVAGGDVITAFEGEPIVLETDLARLVSLAEPGQKVRIEILRDGERREIDVTLGTRPDTPARLLGLDLSPDEDEGGSPDGNDPERSPDGENGD